MKKKWGKTSLSSGLVLAALIPGIACEDSTYLDGQKHTDNEFGVLLEGLGTPLNDCIDAQGALVGTTLTVNLADGEDAVVSVVSNKLKINGHQCLAEAGGTELTSTLVTKLNVVGANGGTNKVVLDLLPGSFGNIFGTTGGVTIDVNGSTMSLGVRGTDAANSFKMAEDSSNNLYMELNGNTAADVRIEGVPDSVVFTMGAGADTFNAQDATNLTITHLGGSGSLTAVLTQDLTVYGGADNDTIEGGNGDDTLYGGAGNDTFQTFTDEDGADTFHGGDGTDTVDYSNRNAGVTVDIDPEYTNPFVQGVVLHGLEFAGAETLDIELDGGNTTINVVFAAAADSVAEILAELNADLGADATASVDDRGRLIIEAATDVDITVTADSTPALFGGTPSATTNLDADDGETGASEGDDVKADVENLKGSAHDDVLTGSILSNTIDGNAGADDISGGPGNGTCASDVDILNGGNDDDTFQMGFESNCGDAIDGGAGTDTANYEMRLVALTITVDGQANDGVPPTATGEKDNIKTTVEIVMGGEGDDSITGGTGNDTIYGGLGADDLFGGSGNDTLVGGPGADEIDGDAGDDFIDEATADTDGPFIKDLSAFEGQDIIHGGTGTNTCDFRRGDTTNTSYTLCYSATTANCAASNDDGVDADDLTNCTHVILDGGDDTVTGSSGDDTVEGGGGVDTIDGGAGNDTLYGDAGNDALTGGAGNDSLDGGAGTNTINGGDGDDICVSPSTGNTACEL